MSEWAFRVVVGAILAAHVVVGLEVDCTFACQKNHTWVGQISVPGCPDIIITSQSDLDVLAPCGAVWGNILIEPSVSGTSLSLNNVTSVFGDISATNNNDLTELLLPSLYYMEGSILLANLSSFTNIQFSNLSSIQPAYDEYPSDASPTLGLIFDTLPVLKSVATMFNSSTEMPSPYIAGALSFINTGLEDLLDFGNKLAIESLILRNNPHLSNINITGLETLKLLDISQNGPSATLLLPDLVSVGNLTISNIATNLSLPAYTMGADGIEQDSPMIFSNNTFDSISVPLLGSCYLGLTLVNNPNLQELDFQELVHLNGLIIENNTMLSSVVFPRVDPLGGGYGTGSALNSTLSGWFTEVSFPAYPDTPTFEPLANFYLNTSNPDFDCSALDKLSVPRDGYTGTKGTYQCGAYAAGSTKDTAKHYTVPKKPLHLSQGAIVGISIGAAAVGIVLLALALRCLSSRMKRKAAARPTTVDELYRLDPEGNHKLPEYTRVGVPGEVLPGYVDDNRASLVSAENVSAEHTVGRPPRYSA